MYQQILEALKDKFKDVNDNVLNRVAKIIAKTAVTAEQVKDAVDGYTLQQVIDAYSDSRATEATQTSIRNYEQKYELKNGVKIEQEDGHKDEQITNKNINHQTGGSIQTPAWAQTLIESNKALTERLNKMEGERTTNNRKQQLLEFLDREINVIKAFLIAALDESYKDDIEALQVETQITPFTISDDKDTINNLITANGGKPIISQREAIALYGKSDDVDKTLQEIAEQQENMDDIFKQQPAQ